MARKLRLQFDGAIYHVTVRGVERRRLFDDDRDRARFGKRIGEAVEDLGIRLYLYCLMTNHVHLLVETPQANLSRFMHKIQTAYTVYYNRRHGGSGHLMQGRFGAKVVDGDAYLLALSRYIHLNPVYVGIAKARSLEDRLAMLRDYAWSSYCGYAGLGEAAAFVDEAPILALVEASAEKRRRTYRRYVELGIAESDTELLGVLHDSRWGIGDEEFQESMREWHMGEATRSRRIEDVSFRRATARLEPGMVLDSVATAFGMSADVFRKRTYGCPAQSVAARLLVKYSGMTQRDVASVMGMRTGTAVCHRLKALATLLETDADLASRFAIIDRNLEASGE